MQLYLARRLPELVDLVNNGETMPPDFR